MTSQAPNLVALPDPRALTAAERALLGRLVAFADVPELTAQVDTARVVSTCDCGCASVGLRTDAPPVPENVVAQRSATGRPDWFAVSAAGRGGVSVVLHVLSGFVGELEIYAGEGVAVGAPPAESLGDFDVY